MKEVFLVLFGYTIGFVQTWVNRKRRIKTHWSVIRAEVDLCHERASNFFYGNVWSPLYRLPVSAYKASFPVLLGDGALSETEYLILGRFYDQAEDINRGLDNTAAMLHANDGLGMEREYKRNVAKTRELIKPSEGNRLLYAEAKGLVDVKIAKPWWRS